MNNSVLKPVLYGLIASAILIAFYFSILTLVSGWSFALDQFFTYWYYISALTIGFGVQIGLFTHLKSKIHSEGQAGKVVAVSGTASTVAMISCCAHYLVNLAPIVGAIGLISFVAQYQIQLFWFGLASNLFGIIYISRRIIKFNAQQNEQPQKCH